MGFCETKPIYFCVCPYCGKGIYSPTSAVHCAQLYGDHLRRDHPEFLKTEFLKTKRKIAEVKKVQVTDNIMGEQLWGFAPKNQKKEVSKTMRT